MRFKFGGAIALGLVSACGLGFSEKPTAPERISLSAAETGCLEKAPENLAGYLEGRTSDATLRADLACAERALTLFMDQTEGAESGVYLPEELKKFLTRYFLNDRDLAESFYQSAFELKAALLGGTAATLTRGELIKAREFLRLGGEQLLRLRPFLPLRTLAEGTDYARLDLASQVFSDIGARFADFIEKSGNRYSFEQFDRGVTELSKLLPQLSPGRFRQAAEMLRVWKSAFLLDPANLESIGPREWRSVLTEGATAYVLLAKFRQFAHSSQQAICGAPRERIVQLAEEALDTLERSLAVRGSTLLPFRDLEKFLDLVSDSDLPVRRATLIATYRPFVTKLLRRQRTSLARPPNTEVTQHALTTHDVAALRAIIRSWNWGQRLAEKPFLDRGGVCGASATYANVLSGRGVPRKAFAKGLDEILGQAAKALSISERERLDAVRASWVRLAPMWEVGGPSMRLGRTSREEYSFSEISVRNSVFQLAEAAQVAYSGGTSMSEVQLDEFYKDIRLLGAELKLMDPRLWSWASLRFKEANLFTPVGNGDRALSVDELVLLVGQLIPARSFAYGVHHEATGRCGSFGPDLYGYQRLEESCYFRFLKERMDRMQDVAPGFAAFYRGLNNAGRDQLVGTLRTVMLPAGQRAIESPYSEIFGALVFFEEGLMERFDLNRNQYIDEDEALRMVPVFRSVLIEKSGLTSQADLDAVLTYTLRNGEPPTRDLGGIAEFLFWKLRRPFWNFEADRLNVFKVFAAFGASPY